MEILCLLYFLIANLKIQKFEEIFEFSVLKIHVQNFIKNDEACSFKILCFSDPKNAGDAIDNINIFLFNYGCRANTVNKRKYIDNILIFKSISTK